MEVVRIVISRHVAVEGAVERRRRRSVVTVGSLHKGKRILRLISSGKNGSDFGLDWDLRGIHVKGISHIFTQING